MDDTRQIGIPSDEEGYISFECPSCEDRFKLHADEYDGDAASTIYCPLCGLNNSIGEFLTKDVPRVAEAHATEMALDAVEKMFGDLERKSRGNKFIKFRAGKRPPRRERPELREVTDLAIVQFACCDRSAKVPHSDALSGVYCPYCGTEQI